MASYTNTNQLFQESETFAPKLQEWLNRFDTPANLIPKRNVTMVSERDFQIPAVTDDAGREGTYDPNFGEIGRGQNERGVKPVITFFPFRMSFEISQLAADATKGRDQARQSNYSRVLKRAMPAFAEFQNRCFFTDGTPVLGVATAQATVGSETRYTMNSALRAAKIRRGQYVSVYDSAMASLKETERVSKVDYKNRYVFTASTISGAAADDVLCFEGVSGATPTGPLGLYYWQSSAETGTTAGIGRDTEPEIRTNSVSASGGLDYILGLNLFHAMLERRGISSLSGLRGIASMSSHAQAVGQVMNLQRIDVMGSTAEMKDLLPKVSTKFPFAGVPHDVVPYQNATRIEWISPQETWGVARLHDTKHFEVGGNRFFPIYGSGGSPAAGLWFALICNQNWFCMNPGANGLFDSIPVEAPYA